MAITLNDDQVKRLEASILEVPAKYAIPLLQLINSFVAENTPPIKTEPEEAHVVSS